MYMYIAFYKKNKIYYVPMLNKYNTNIAPESKELKQGPSQKSLDYILNYSKSTELKKNKQQEIVLFLN